MSFEKLIRIPNDRIAVLIGKSGNIKSKIENSKLNTKCKNENAVPKWLDSGIVNLHCTGKLNALEKEEEEEEEKNKKKKRKKVRSKDKRGM